MLPPHPLGGKKTITLENNTYYFAGFDSQNVYLADREKPGAYTSINLLTLDTTHHQFNLVSLQDKKHWILTIENNVSLISNYLTGNIIILDPNKKWSILQNPIKTNPVQQIIALPDSTLLIKSFDPLKGKQIVQKFDLPTQTNLNQFYPDSKIDSFYSSAGILAFDDNNNNIFYVHNYWNKISILNQNLSIISNATSIDPKKEFTQNIFRYGNSQSPSMRIEGHSINQFATAKEGRLFIHSLTPAKNQSIAEFQKHWTVDVYSTSPFEYKFSFYVPNFKGNSSKEFRIRNDQLYLLQKNSFTRYELKLPAF